MTSKTNGLPKETLFGEAEPVKKLNARGNEILFKRVLLLSYIPENAKGLGILFLLFFLVALPIAFVELIEWMIGNTDLSILQFSIFAVGAVAIQLFAIRHS